MYNYACFFSYHICGEIKLCVCVFSRFDTIRRVTDRLTHRQTQDDG